MTADRLPERASAQRQSATATNGEKGVFGALRTLRHALRRYGVARTLGLVLKNLVHPLRVRLSPRERAYRRQSREFDRAHGADTAREVHLGELDLDGQTAAHARCYTAVRPHVFREFMRSLPVDARRLTFLDLGSGKGRALLLALEYDFRRIIGVEVSRELHAVAEENLRRVRTRNGALPPVESRLKDAARVAFPAEPLLLYLFNPFGGAIVSRVIERLEESLREAPRPVVVVYVNPEHGALFERCPFLTRCGSGEAWTMWGNTEAFNERLRAAADAPSTTT